MHGVVHGMGEGSYAQSKQYRNQLDLRIMIYWTCVALACTVLV